jgi:uncharacterized membrane protein
MKKTANHISTLSGAEMPPAQAIPLQSVGAGLLGFITSTHPKVDTQGFATRGEITELRAQYVSQLLQTESGKLSKMQQEVLDSMSTGKLLADDVDKKFEQNTTFGQRLADKVAEFGGSWGFIILFFSVLAVWIVLNASRLFFEPFDPYPFILLNLVLSCLAAIQAPIIMMSQNRMEAKDRERSINDYKVNLRSELEVRQLDSKMDYLILQQMHTLLDLQQQQYELLHDIVKSQIRESPNETEATPGGQ